MQCSIFVLGLLLAAQVAFAAETSAPRLKEWTLAGSLTGSPRQTTRTLPLSDQNNTVGWVPLPSLWDDFDGTTLNTNRWVAGLEWWNGKRPAWFSPANTSVSNGQLHLAMKREAPPPAFEALGYSNYTASAIHSVSRAHYGYYEIRAKAMSAAASSGFWFQVEEVPHTRTEIDVFEVCGKSPEHDRDYLMASHVFWTPGNEDHWQISSVWKTPWRFSDDFHVYGFEWREDELRWYVDGVLVRTLENGPWRNPLFLVLDTEVKSSWWGLPENSDLPAVFDIDYVHAWKPAPSAKPH